MYWDRRQLNLSCHQECSHWTTTLWVIVYPTVSVSGCLGLGEEKIDEEEIGEVEVSMLAAGAGTRSEPRRRVIELRRDLLQECALLLSINCLNMLFTEWRRILLLHQLSLILPMSCDHNITWPDLSALRVLKIVIRGKTSWKLNTFIPHLSFTIAPGNDYSQVEYDNCVAIGDHISTNSLKELHLLAHSINVKGVEAITAALASNQSLPLERLEFKCECTFTATAGDSLAQFITNTTILKYLSIKKCTFSAHALLVLARAIHHNSILQTKNVQEFMFTVNGDNEAKDLAQLLVEYQELMDEMYSPMSYMYIHCTGVSDAGAVAVGQALHHNSTLTCLYLPNNSISDAGAVALAEALHHNSTLTQLHLYNNSISDAGAVALAQALRHNSTLV